MRLPSFYRLLFITAGIALILFGVNFIYFYYQDKPNPEAFIETLPITQEQTRLLVVAPHCDDEALGSAGMIHDVIQAGGTVLVVIMTNGDGFTFATKEQFHRLFLSPDDYIHSGYTRQQESIVALELLGVPESQVVFFGYPDRGLDEMWRDHWDIATPFTSHYTGTDHSPYANSYQPSAPYSGQAVIDNLEKVISAFQPTMIVFPHPNDEHHDHSATWAFVFTSVSHVKESNLRFSPKLYTYLIHRGDFPIPHGYRPESPLLPPRPLAQSVYPQWYMYPLKPDTKQNKEKSIKSYVSQLHVPIMSNLLNSFIRTNELFTQVHPTLVQQVPKNNDLFSLDSWATIQPLLVNPPGVNPLGALERKAKVNTAYSCIQNNVLWLRFHIPEFARKQNQYDMYLVEFQLQQAQLLRKAQTIRFSSLDTDVPETDITRSKDDVIIRLPFTQETMPDFFFLQVVTKDRFSATIDRTIWQPAFISHQFISD